MVTIYPGETLDCMFTLPFNVSTCRKAIVSFKQFNRVMLEFECTSFTRIDDNKCIIRHKLTQNESLKLRNLEAGYIQINVYDVNNNRLSSNPINITIGEQFHRDIIE